MVKAYNTSSSEVIDRFVYQYMKHSVDKSLSKSFKAHRTGVSKLKEPELFESLKTHIFKTKIAQEENNEDEKSKEDKVTNVKKIQCHICEEFGHLSFACPQKKSLSVSKSEEGVQCFKCQGYGHMSFSCPKSSQESSQGASGKENRAGGPPGKNKFNNKRCYNCNEFGHVSNECPQVQCYKCYEYGHFSSKCPNVSEATGANSTPLGTRKTPSQTDGSLVEAV